MEDEPLLAIDLEDQLTHAGYAVVGAAPSVARAINCIAEVHCDVAILDFNLRGETAVLVAEELLRLGTPFIFLSGISEEQLPASMKEIRVLSKPVNAEVLLSTLRQTLHE